MVLHLSWVWQFMARLDSNSSRGRATVNHRGKVTIWESKPGTGVGSRTWRRGGQIKGPEQTQELSNNTYVLAKTTSVTVFVKIPRRSPVYEDRDHSVLSYSIPDLVWLPVSVTKISYNFTQCARPQRPCLASRHQNAMTTESLLWPGGILVRALNLREGDEHPIYTPCRVWHSFTFPLLSHWQHVHTVLIYTLLMTI